MQPPKPIREISKEAIPVPFFGVQENQLPLPPQSVFQQPATYIRYREPDFDRDIWYDADDQDRQWLQEYNKDRTPIDVLTMDVFEATVDFIEKIQGANQDCLVVDPCQIVLPKMARFQMNNEQLFAQNLAVFRWWKQRRYCRVKKGYPLGKPLLPHLENFPDPTDIQQPFHRRDATLSTTSCAPIMTQNTHQLYDELVGQLQFLRQALQSLDLIREREVIKKKAFETQFAIWRTKRASFVRPADARRHRPVRAIKAAPQTFAEHVLSVYGPNDPVAKEMAKIKDLSQFLAKLRQMDAFIPAYRIHLRPSPNSHPPSAHISMTPCLGRNGVLLWPIQPTVPASASSPNLRPSVSSRMPHVKQQQPNAKKTSDGVKEAVWLRTDEPERDEGPGGGSQEDDFDVDLYLEEQDRLLQQQLLASQCKKCLEESGKAAAAVLPSPSKRRKKATVVLDNSSGPGASSAFPFPATPPAMPPCPHQHHHSELSGTMPLKGPTNSSGGGSGRSTNNTHEKFCTETVAKKWHTFEFPDGTAADTTTADGGTSNADSRSAVGIPTS